MLFRSALRVACASLLAINGAASKDKKPCNVIKTDVVIVGGGAAGTYAAIQLFDKGVDIVVVEKQSDLGGHADTYIDPTTGGVLNAGVILLHNTTLVRDYAARLGVALTSPSFDSNATTLNVDFDNGLQSVNPLADPETFTQLAKYLEIVQTKFAYLAPGFYLPEPVDEDLVITFGDFAKKYGVEKVVFLVNLYTQGWDVAKVPAVYGLMVANAELVTKILTNDFVTTTDINDLYRSAATILGSRILFNSNIQSVSRDASGVTVTVRQKGGPPRIIKAKKLLMTGAPLMNNFKGWDLSAEEQDIFGEFHAFGYYAGVVSNPGFPDDTSFTNVAANTTFHTPELPAIFGISDTPFPNKTRTVYYGTETAVDAKKAAKDCLSDIDSLLVTLGYGTAKTELLAWYSHAPFDLEVSADEIRKGFYRRLYGLQGQKNTWWSGATFTAHDSTQIWEFSENTVIGPLSA